ncbi:MAG TPA: 23S rRNA pseudouridine(2604) synthase RluF [Chitinophagaceae bacterium]|nr:23S rRNA pseudouridine(2604) synthase RluF [Chitinophagaceae bacterium]
MQNEGIQINKYISSSGYCSRREADKLIEQGRVMINDKVAKLTQKVTDSDSVSVDFEYIKKKKVQAVYMAFNKPIGITSTTDTNDKTNIISFINYPKRIFPIGRLDKDSEGLILLTNDGDIVNKILRAENNHDKEYLVTVNKGITQEFINHMSNGVEILGTTTLKCKVKQESGKKFRIILKQGLNRQIRRMCEALGYDVQSLVRIRIMNIHLDKLQTGKWRYLSQTEIAELENSLRDSSK